MMFTSFLMGVLEIENKNKCIFEYISEEGLAMVGLQAKVGPLRLS